MYCQYTDYGPCVCNNKNKAKEVWYELWEIKELWQLWFLWESVLEHSAHPSGRCFLHRYFSLRSDGNFYCAFKKIFIGQSIPPKGAENYLGTPSTLITHYKPFQHFQSLCYVCGTLCGWKESFMRFMNPYIKKMKNLFLLLFRFRFCLLFNNYV